MITGRNFNGKNDNKLQRKQAQISTGLNDNRHNGSRPKLQRKEMTIGCDLSRPK